MINVKKMIGYIKVIGQSSFKSAIFSLLIVIDATSVWSADYLVLLRPLFEIIFELSVVYSFVC